MTPISSLFTVVVLGAMNPRIHNPAWYKFSNLITEEEYDRAIERNSFTTPPLAQVEAGPLAISCSSDRWEVRTTSSEESDRMPVIACKVFDEFLKYTSVQAYGFNFHFSFDLRNHASGRLHRALLNTGLFKGQGGITSAKFQMSRKVDDFVQRCEVSVAGESEVLIATNYHHRIETKNLQSDYMLFDLGQSLTDDYIRFREESLNLSIEYAEHLSNLQPV